MNQKSFLERDDQVFVGKAMGVSLQLDFDDSPHYKKQIRENSTNPFSLTPEDMYIYGV